jgi:hypothetical protein
MNEDLSAMKNLDNYHILVWTCINGETDSSDTSIFLRKWRRAFGCKHKYIRTINRFNSNVNSLSYDGSPIKDYICPKCWSILDNDQYQQIQRDNKLKELI